MTIDYKSAGYTAFPFMAVNPLDSEQSIEVLNEKVRPGEVIGHEGMTLRDYFAASALQGFIADKDNWTSAVRAAGELGITTESGIAALMFKMADAMLAEREK